MNIDVNKHYFKMSFRFNKTKPEDFGLIPSDDETMLIDKDDNSLWIKQELYDFGWGNEIGFIRLPKLNFNQLWELLINSNLQDNKYGAAYQLENEYPEILLNYLIGSFDKPNPEINNSVNDLSPICRTQES